VSTGTARGTITLHVDDSRCRACGKCLAKQICRGNALRVLDPGEAPFLDMSRCWGCMVCLAACPFGAIVRSMPKPEETRQNVT
jgi:MinD superfamily P-loop ATPase